MGQVAVSLMGRNYRFVCGDGEEPRIKALSDYLRTKVDQLSQEMGRTADDRLLVMAALILADELFEARGTVIEGATAAPSPVRTKKSGAA
jgi:cell division protein ZapA